ncbi:LLM class flavin-dependent oxidoreductase [Chitinophaga lutea]
MKKIKLSILDQSHVRQGSTTREALQETIALAQLAEKLGYYRFWVSEHHNIPSIAGSTPEVLIASLGAHTSSIRLGAAGIMLPNHSSLKVAENFRMLEALYPGRIDLGVGRAPGGDRLTARLLNPQNTFSEQEFIQQIIDLQHYTTDEAPAGSIYEKVKAMPQAETAPPLWLLTSSGGSAQIAAHFGTALSFAHFINPQGGPETVAQYRANFRPSDTLRQPEANFGIFAFCHEDEDVVRRWQAEMDHRLLHIERGRDTPLPAWEEIEAMEYMPEEQLRINFNRGRMICGTPAQMRTQIERLMNAYETDEIVLCTIAQDAALRLHSFELLAKVFAL